MKLRSLQYVFLFVVLLGLADALYLALTTYLNISPVCGPAHGCDVVQTSSYSRILGIPWAYLAVLYYLAGAMLGPSLSSSILARKLSIVFGLLGVVVGIWSVYLQVFVLHAFCVYCTALDIFALILCILSLSIYHRARVTMSSLSTL